MPKGAKGKKGKGKGKALSPPVLEPVQLEPVQLEPAQEEEDESKNVDSLKAKRKRNVLTNFSEEQKEEIIEFLMQNKILYSKRLAGFKDVIKKEAIWAAQAAQMGTTVDELKTYNTSMRSTMSRPKKRCNKSGSGGDSLTDLNATEKWVFDKFAFLAPHIETLDARNVASFSTAIAGARESERASSTDLDTAETSTSSRAPTPSFPSASPPASQTSSQPGSVSSRRGSDERMTSGELKEMLVTFMSRSSDASGSSFFGKYVDETLSTLPREIRREAEANIMQELHRAQRAAEHNLAQLPPSQDQQPHFQVQQRPQHSQPTMWQPQPSQWPNQPVGPQTSVWGSQDRSYVQRQFPSVSMTSPGNSGIRSSTITATTTTLPSTIGESFYNLLGPGPQDVGGLNYSPHFNPVEEDETVIYPTQTDRTDEK